MLTKTEGIVLGTFSYSDTYSITHVYTRDFGTVAYLLPKPRSRRSKVRPSLFFPLSLLRLEVEHLPLRDVQRMKEVERLVPLYSLCTDMIKASIAFFLAEFLLSVLRESDRNEATYDYIRHSIELLEVTEKGVANFHLAFMIGLTKHMGIHPNVEGNEGAPYFDLLSGEFVRQSPLHSHYLKPGEGRYLRQLERMTFRNMHLYRLSRVDRNLIVDYFLKYYRLHLYDFPRLKSLEVLREL
ncbi:MAG: DNA repair protein RecO [Bacteroidota bacterium]|jgi:DNA repair protein RecO (recombination protein O)|nr:DNA repair protein RecO [Bacteroidota bacterium]HHU97099.1 DNA repair protein RecO [Petrimonas sp.]